ncbi:MAG: hypothetical protein IKE63_03845 [Bacilli bacterium]|nr:hypothetical protein [Bacilli bacterium]
MSAFLINRDFGNLPIDQHTNSNVNLNEITDVVNTGAEVVSDIPSRVADPESIDLDTLATDGVDKVVDSGIENPVEPVVKVDFADTDTSDISTTSQTPDKGVTLPKVLKDGDVSTTTTEQSSNGNTTTNPYEVKGADGASTSPKASSTNGGKIGDSGLSGGNKNTDSGGMGGSVGGTTNNNGTSGGSGSMPGASMNGGMAGLSGTPSNMQEATDRAVETGETAVDVVDQNSAQYNQDTLRMTELDFSEEDLEKGLNPEQLAAYRKFMNQQVNAAISIYEDALVEPTAIQEKLDKVYSNAKIKKYASLYDEYKAPFVKKATNMVSDSVKLTEGEFNAKYSTEGIKYSEVKGISVEELVNKMIYSDKYKETTEKYDETLDNLVQSHEGFEEYTYAQLAQEKQATDMQVANIEAQLDQAKELRKNSDNDTIRLSKEFKDYQKAKDVVVSGDVKVAVNEKELSASVYTPTIITASYTDYLKDHPGTTVGPVDYYKDVKEKVDALKDANPNLINAQVQIEMEGGQVDFETLLVIAETDPDFVDTYQYKYLNDPADAKKYLEEEKDTMNKAGGFADAQADIDQLELVNSEEIDKFTKEFAEVDFTNETEVKNYLSKIKNLDINNSDQVLEMVNLLDYSNPEQLQKDVADIVDTINGSIKIRKSLENTFDVAGAGLGGGMYDAGEGFAKMFKDGEITRDDYKKMMYASYLEQHSAGYSLLYQGSSAVGNMVPSITATVVVSVVAPEFAPSLTAAQINNIAQWTGLGIMSLSSYGTTQNDMLAQGYDKTTARTYAILNAASEIVTEKYLGGLEGLSDDVISLTAKQTLKDKTLSFVKNALSEGNEELIQQLLQGSVFDTVILGKDLDLDTLTDDALKAYFLGMASAGVLNTYSGTLSLTIGGIKYQFTGKNFTEIQNLWNQPENMNKSYTEILDMYSKMHPENVNNSPSVSQEVNNPTPEVALQDNTQDDEISNNSEIDLDKPVMPAAEKFDDDFDYEKYSDSKSDYSLEDIMGPQYKKLCDKMFEMAPSQEAKEVLEDILYRGKFNDFYFSSDISHKDNSQIEAQRRLSMAELYLTNPRTCKYLCDNKINLFHGTNAVALESILKNGLNSLAASSEEKIDVKTGEEWSRAKEHPRGFVSFADVLGISKGYSQISVDESDLSFPIIIGTTTEEGKKAGTIQIHSDISEIGIKNKLPAESIKVILVPAEKLNIVKEMVNDSNVVVLPMAIEETMFDVDGPFIEVYDGSSIKKLVDSNKVSDYDIHNQTLSDTMGDSATVIDVSTLDMSQNPLSKDVNLNISYEGYDYVLKPNSIEKTLNKVRNITDQNILIELTGIEGLNSEMLENLPDNIRIRISDYNQNHYNSNSSPQSSLATLDHLTYSPYELQVIMDRINNIKNGIDKNWNDYQKAEYIYNYLKNHVKYEAPLEGTAHRTKNYDGLGLLIAGTSTCQGFAHTYKILLNSLGIQCEEVWGQLNAQGKHAYNVVKIGNNTFVVDTVRNKMGKYEDTGFGVDLNTVQNQYSDKTNNDLMKDLNSYYDEQTKSIYNESFENERKKIKDAFDLDEKVVEDKNIIDALLKIKDNTSNIQNEDIKFLLNNITDILIKNGIRIGTWDAPTAYSSPMKVIGFNTDCAMDPNNTFMNMFHENGHMLHYNVDGSNDYLHTITLSDEEISIVRNARENFELTPKIVKILTESMERVKQANIETNKWYESQRESENKRIADIVDKLFDDESGRRDLLEDAKSFSVYQEIENILKENGIEIITDENNNSTIANEDILLSNKELMTDILQRGKHITNKLKYNESLYSDYNKYGLDRKISSMLNALLTTSKPIDLGNGKKFYFEYCHTDEYYAKNREYQSLAELIADYFSIHASGNQEIINTINTLLGKDMVNLLNTKYKQFADAMRKQLNDDNIKANDSTLSGGTLELAETRNLNNELFNEPVLVETAEEMLDKVMTGIENIQNIKDQNVKYLLNNVTTILKNSGVKIELHSDDTHYSPSKNMINIDSNHLVNIKQTINTMVHEVGHAFHHINDGLDIRLTDKQIKILQDGRSNLTDKQLKILEKYQQKTVEIKQKSQDYYLSIHKPVMMKILEKVENIFDLGIQDDYKEELMNASEYVEIQKYLKNLGLDSETDIDEILHNKEIFGYIMVLQNAISTRCRYEMDLCSSEEYRGVRIVSAMLNALLTSNKSIALGNGSKYVFLFSHDDSYYGNIGRNYYNKNYRNEKSFSELIATYNELQALHDEETVNDVHTLLGDDVINMLADKYDEIAQNIWEMLDDIKNGKKPKLDLINNYLDDDYYDTSRNRTNTR